MAKKNPTNRIYVHLRRGRFNPYVSIDRKRRKQHYYPTVSSLARLMRLLNLYSHFWHFEPILSGDFVGWCAICKEARNALDE